MIDLQSIQDIILQDGREWTIASHLARPVHVLFSGLATVWVCFCWLSKENEIQKHKNKTQNETITDSVIALNQVNRCYCTISIYSAKFLNFWEQKNRLLFFRARRKPRSNLKFWPLCDAWPPKRLKWYSIVQFWSNRLSFWSFEERKKNELRFSGHVENRGQTIYFDPSMTCDVRRDQNGTVSSQVRLQ